MVMALSVRNNAGRGIYRDIQAKYAAARAPMAGADCRSQRLSRWPPVTISPFSARTVFRPAGRASWRTITASRCSASPPPVSPLRLPRAIDLALPLATRPASWRMCAEPRRNPRAARPLSRPRRRDRARSTCGSSPTARLRRRRWRIWPSGTRLRLASRGSDVRRRAAPHRRGHAQRLEGRRSVDAANVALSFTPASARRAEHRRRGGRGRPDRPRRRCRDPRPPARGATTRAAHRAGDDRDADRAGPAPRRPNHALPRSRRHAGAARRISSILALVSGERDVEARLASTPAAAPSR